MQTPIEYDPYGLMMKLFLMEAAEMCADEILLVSGEGYSHLYFVAANRVQKRVKLQSDVTPDLAIRMSNNLQPDNPAAKAVRIKVIQNDIINRLTVPSGKPSADVDSTIQMPVIL